MGGSFERSTWCIARRIVLTDTLSKEYLIIDYIHSNSDTMVKLYVSAMTPVDFLPSTTLKGMLTKTYKYIQSSEYPKWVDARREWNDFRIYTMDAKTSTYQPSQHDYSKMKSIGSMLVSKDRKTVFFVAKKGYHSGVLHKDGSVTPLKDWVTNN